MLATCVLLRNENVLFGAAPATNVGWIDATHLLCLAPAVTSAGTVDVTITQGANSVVYPDAFSYLGLIITGIDVAKGNVTGGSVVRLAASVFSLSSDVRDVIRGPEIFFPLTGNLLLLNV